MFNKITVDKIVAKLSMLIQQLEEHAAVSSADAIALEHQLTELRTEAQRAQRIKAKLQELLN